MTVHDFICEHVTGPFRILYKGCAMFDSTLTKYECPAFIGECLITDAWTTAYGMTIITI